MKKTLMIFSLLLLSPYLSYLSGSDALIAMLQKRAQGGGTPPMVRKSQEDKENIGAVGVTVPTGAAVVGGIFEGTLGELDSLVIDVVSSFKGQLTAKDKVQCAFAHNRLNCSPATGVVKRSELSETAQKKASQEINLMQDMVKALAERKKRQENAK